MKYNNNVKRFFKNFTIIVIVIIALDFLIGSLLKHYYFKQKFNKITNAINNTKEDFLIFGSSRALHHYIPAVFEKKLNVTCYNCGRDDGYLIFHLALISAIIERYTPKHIILDITPDEFSISEEGRLAMLLPYYNDLAVKPYVEYNSRFEKIKLLSHIYPYNSLFGIIVVNNLSSRPSPPSSNNGYMQLGRTMTYSEKVEFKHEEIIKSRIQLLNDFLMKSNKKQIKVTLVISPVYCTFRSNDIVVSIIDSLCHKYKNVNFFNYENSSQFTDYKLFNDERHLNDFGANKFSEDLANKLLVK